MYKHKILICFLTSLSLLLNFSAFAKDSFQKETLVEEEFVSEEKATISSEKTINKFITVDSITGKETVTQQPITIDENEIVDQPIENDDSISLTSTFSDPQEAFLKVNTNCYAAPCSTNGYLLQVVPTNTRVWVVEKKYCSHSNCFFYYAGYNLNGEAHRGYFHEDNVYLTSSSRLLPDNVDDEYAPANYKNHTSKEGTVYDGPADTYSIMGSVGNEAIKLIRTDSHYNFIEYSVNGTNKVKRGYLYYSQISGNWGSLTAKNRGLDGQVLYIYSGNSQQYLTTPSSSNKTYSKLESFAGEISQLYKFTYVDDETIGPYFYIQPVIGYDNTDDETNTNRRLEIQAVSGRAHDGRRVTSYTVDSSRRQKYWIVKSTLSGYYKIVPLCTYGTMTWHAKANSPADVTQSYTLDMFYNEDGNQVYLMQDLWKLKPSNIKTNSGNFEELKENWCWAVGAHIAASAETPFDTTVTQREAVMAARDDNIPDLGDEDSGGSIYDSAQVANYFMNRNINSNYFVGYENKIFSESNLQKFIHDDHSVMTAFRAIPNNDQGHLVTFVAFEWFDCQNGEDAPGYYLYGFYCPDKYPNITKIKYNQMINSSYLVTNYSSKWQQTAVYRTAYATETITGN